MPGLLPNTTATYPGKGVMTRPQANKQDKSPLLR